MNPNSLYHRNSVPDHGPSPPQTNFSSVRVLVSLADDENGVVVGNIHGNERAPVDRKEDHCRASLYFHSPNATKFASRFDLQLDIYYHDEDDNYVPTTVVGYMDERNIVEHFVVRKYTDLDEEHKRQFDKTFGVDHKKEEWKAVMDKLYRATVVIDGGKSKQGMNLFNRSKYGKQQKIVELFRDKFRGKQTITLAVNATYVASLVQKCTNNLKLIEVSDAIRNFFPQKRHLQTSNLCMTRSELESATRPEAPFLTQFTFKNNAYYIALMGHAVMRHKQGYQFWALEKLVSQANRGHQHSRNVMKSLRAENFEDFPTSDFWMAIYGGQAPAILASLKPILNVKQFQIVQAMRSVKGPFHLITGPTGTGKTKLAVEIILRAMRGTQVLVVAPSNAIATYLARLLRIAVLEYGEEPEQHGFLPQNAHDFLVVRYSNEVIERQIFERAARAQQAGIEHTSEQDQHASEGRDENTWNEPRINTPEVSVGYAIGVYCGLIKKDNGDNWSWARPDDQDCTDFCNLYRRYSRGEQPISVIRNTFIDAFDALRTKILGLARVVCTATSNAAQKSLYDDFNPRLIVFDEASRLSEPECWGVFASYQAAELILLFGDPQMPGPIVNLSNVRGVGPDLTSFLKLSFFTRLLVAGAETTTLTEQYRCRPQIANLMSQFFYNNTLRNSPSLTAPGVEMATESYKELNQSLFDVKSNIVLAMTSKTTSRHHEGSVFNVSEVIIVIEILRKYLKNDVLPQDIAILTPYNAQFSYLKRSIRELGEDMDLDLSGVIVRTFDQAIGDERDVVIASLAITESLGFLWDSRRLNAAFSRARLSLVIVADVRKIQAIQNFRKAKLCKIFDSLLEENKFVAPPVSRTPDFLRSVLPSTST